jgi:predicted dehydrogenase
MTARINAGKIPSGSWLTDAREGGGRIVGEVCHFVDLMTYWAGAPPVRVSAHAIGQGGAYERDDNVVIGLTFAEGSVGTLAYSAMGDVSIGKERYEVMGEGKSATIDDWRKLEIVSRGNKRVQRALRADKGHGEEVGAFVAACAGRKPSPTPWADVKAVTLATFAIERAWRQGRDVDLSDLVERYPR